MIRILKLINENVLELLTEHLSNLRALGDELKRVINEITKIQIVVIQQQLLI